jgi:hypothetical protein
LRIWEHYHLNGGDEVIDGVTDRYTYTYDRAGNIGNRRNKGGGTKVTATTIDWIGLFW